jgi:hypothetical protein
MILLITASLMGVVTSVIMWQSIHAKKWWSAGYYGVLTATWAFILHASIYN